MSFVWPEALWLLLAVPALVGLYVLLLRRKSRQAMRYASLTLMREAQAGHRRYPPAPAAAAVPAGDDRVDRRDRPPPGDGDAALRAANDHHGDGRVVQHAGDRRRAEPHCRGPRGRQGIRAGSAARTCASASLPSRRRRSWCSSRRATARSSSPPSTGCSCNTTRRSAARSSCRSLPCSPTRAWHSRRRRTAWGRRANARAGYRSTVRNPPRRRNRRRCRRARIATARSSC